MPIPLHSDLTKELSTYSQKELIELNAALDDMINEIKQMPFKEFERKLKGEKETIPDETTEFTAIKVVDNKLQLINEEKDLIIEVYVFENNEDAVKDFQTLVELLGLEVIKENEYAK
ncbi:hypothetical protein [Caminibacter sp.]